MPESLIPFIITSIAIEVTPGPNMAYLAVLSVDRGRIAGLAAVAGVALGLAVLGVAAGYGLGVAISTNRWLYETIRWGGVLYLFWLAYDTWQDSRRPVEVEDGPQRLVVYFRRGLITNLLNPKAAVFYVAVMPNFVDPFRSVGTQSVLLTTIYVTVATIIHAAIVAAAGSLRPLFVTHDGLRGRLGLVFALLLVAIAIWLLVTTRQV